MGDVRLRALSSLADQLTRTVPADCFFVTVAVLLGTTVDEISRRTGLQVPQPGTEGVTISQIIHALTNLGLVFNAWTCDEPQGGSGGPLRARHPHRFDVNSNSRAGIPRVVGIVYRRPNGSGHVVVCHNPGRPHYCRYLDYQANPAGQDVAQDVHASRIYAYFAVDMVRSGGGFINQQRQAIEQMEVDEEQAHPNPEPMEWEDETHRFWRHDEL